ncbi:MAG: hypothetical protein PW788_07810 [Micavibrio sp.]|nr:hypothetical protein [Micavibrio sp.]
MNNMHTPNQGQNQSGKNAGSFDKSSAGKSSIDKNVAGRDRDLGRKVDGKDINKERRDDKNVDQRRT